MQKRNNCVAPPVGMIGPRVACLSKMTKIAFNKAAAEQGLFSGQQDILFLINNNEGISLGELSKELGVAVATASVSVKRMEKAGFIIKKADEDDARLTRLYPTEKAKQAPENIRRKMDMLDDVLKKGMTEEETHILSKLLDRAIENMKSEDNIDD
ncbi:MAG: MarR family transcriptional regulator [Eubacterium sp.]|nr:MarR family transcriptional regulator [Eubacterium sp.]